jgi:hypothetical protein
VIRRLPEFPAQLHCLLKGGIVRENAEQLIYPWIRLRRSIADLELGLELRDIALKIGDALFQTCVSHARYSITPARPG